MPDGDVSAGLEIPGGLGAECAPPVLDQTRTGHRRRRVVDRNTCAVDSNERLTQIAEHSRGVTYANAEAKCAIACEDADAEGRARWEMWSEDPGSVVDCEGPGSQMGGRRCRQEKGCQYRQADAAAP